MAYRDKEYGKKKALKWRQDHREQELAKAKVRRRLIRDAVYDYYGGKCVCCGEHRKSFLSIDHEKNDGASHKVGRKRRLSGHTFHRWLLSNNLPSGYQVLCMNCNFSKHFNWGTCEHKSI